MAPCFQGRVYKLNLRWFCASRLRGTIQFGLQRFNDFEKAGCCIISSKKNDGH